MAPTEGLVASTDLPPAARSDTSTAVLGCALMLAIAVAIGLSGYLLVGRAGSAASKPTATVATATPTASAARTAAAAPSGTVRITRTFFQAWSDSIGDVDYEIVIEVKDTGTSAANIHSGDQSYTVFATGGSVLETGTFSYSFPQVLSPGELGYYVAGGTFDRGTTLASVGQLTPSLSYRNADDVPAPWDFSAVTVAKDPLFGGAEVSGVVTNTSSEDATLGVVGVVLFDADGNILGGLVDNVSVMSLRAGQSKGFKTSYPGTPPLDPASVKNFKTFGLDYNFF